mgnify:CR=1 FL=1
MDEKFLEIDEIIDRMGEVNLTNDEMPESNQIRMLITGKTDIPDSEIALAQWHDICMIYSWWLENRQTLMEWVIEGYPQISDMPSPTEIICNNTMHGYQIAKKIVTMGTSFGIDRNMYLDFLVCVYLHDCVKYNQDEVVRLIMDQVFGDGMRHGKNNHGVNAYLLITRLFHGISLDISYFLCIHTKKHPWKCNQKSMNLLWMAFFVLDDLIRGIDIYKLRMPRNDYDIVNKFLQRPRPSDILPAFNIMREYNLTK